MPHFQHIVYDGVALAGVANLIPELCQDITPFLRERMNLWRDVVRGVAATKGALLLQEDLWSRL